MSAQKKPPHAANVKEAGGLSPSEDTTILSETGDWSKTPRCTAGYIEQADCLAAVRILGYIIRKRWKPGHPVYVTSSMLADRLRLSKYWVKTACQLLVDDGVVTRTRAGRGWNYFLTPDATPDGPNSRRESGRPIKKRATPVASKRCKERSTGVDPKGSTGVDLFAPKRSTGVDPYHYGERGDYHHETAAVEVKKAATATAFDAKKKKGGVLNALQRSLIAWNQKWGSTMRECDIDTVKGLEKACAESGLTPSQVMAGGVAVHRAKDTKKVTSPVGLLKHVLKHEKWRPHFAEVEEALKPNDWMCPKCSIKWRNTLPWDRRCEPNGCGHTE